MLRTCTMGVKGPEPKYGDLIEILRDGHQHWAVYIGDWYVVHLVADSGIGSSESSSTVSGGRVMREKLQDVVKNNKWKINNIHDDKCKPRPTQEIVKKALLKVGEDVKYSVSNWNCEHFTTWCRYGKALSVQSLPLRMQERRKDTKQRERKRGDMILDT